MTDRKKRLLLFSYAEHPRMESKGTERGNRLHEYRDGHAAYLVSKLMSPDLVPDVFLNSPMVQAERSEDALKHDLRDVSTILLVTRPALNDVPIGANKFRSQTASRKAIRTTGRWLEAEVHNAIRRVIPYCDRKTVKVQIPGQSLQEYNFQVTDKALVLKSERRAHPWTLCFLLLTGRLWRAGPNLCCVFGMSGPMTLAWAWILYHHPVAKMLSQPIRGERDRELLVIVKVQPSGFDQKLTDLMFTAAWPVTVLQNWPSETTVKED
jgi:hypothetical protein